MAHDIHRITDQRSQQKLSSVVRIIQSYDYGVIEWAHSGSPEMTPVQLIPFQNHTSGQLSGFWSDHNCELIVLWSCAISRKRMLFCQMGAGSSTGQRATRICSQINSTKIELKSDTYV